MKINHNSLFIKVFTIILAFSFVWGAILYTPQTGYAEAPMTPMQISQISSVAKQNQLSRVAKQNQLSRVAKQNQFSRVAKQNQLSDTPDASQVSFVSQMGGNLEDIEVIGNYAYLAVGARLSILDISNPNSPLVIGNSPIFAELIQDVAVSSNGNFAYLAVGNLGLQVIDCSVKTNPTTIGYYYWVANANSVLAVSNDYLYMTDTNNKKIWVINIQNPNTPYTIGASLLLSDFIVSFIVDNNNAYAITAGDDLLKFDISGASITNPTLVSTLDLSTLTDPLSGVKDLVIDSSATPAYAYIIGLDGLRKINLSTNTQTNTYAPLGLQMSSLDIDRGESTLFIAAQNFGLQVLDFSLNVKGTFSAIPSYPITKVVKAGRYAYVRDSSIGMRVIHIPSTWALSPLTLNQVSKQNYYSARDVDILNNYAYIAANNGGMNIVSIDTPAIPVFKSNYASSGLAIGIQVQPNYAYLTFNAIGGGLEKIKISDPTFPTLEGKPISVLGNSVSSVDIDNNYAYTAANTQGLQVINLSTTLAVASFTVSPTTSTWAYDVVKSGNYAYLAYGASGLRIVDVPAKPSGKLNETGFYDTPGDARAIALNGSQAYVADGANGIQIIDVSNPSIPKLIRNVPLSSGEAQDIFIYNNYAYVAAGTAGLRIFSIANLSNVTEVGYYDTPGFATRLTVLNDYVYVADDGGGVLGLRMGSTPSPTPMTPVNPTQITPVNPTTQPIGYGYSISGRVMDGNGSPIPGVYISNGSQVVTTDQNGNYILPGLSTGIYTIAPSKTGYLFAPITVVITSGNVGGCDFTAGQGAGGPFSITGRITETYSNNPVAGVVVSDGTRSATTNSSGIYTIVNVPYGSYLVQPYKEGYSFSPASMNVAVPPNASGRDFRAAVNPPYTINGRIIDTNSEPVSGVLITDGTGRTTTTDSNGNYQISGLQVGMFTITASKNGLIFNPSTIVGSVPPNAIDKNFTALAAPLYSVSGRVTDMKGNGVGDITIMDDKGRTTITNQNGNYTLSNMPEGKYTIRASKNGIRFSPDNLSGSIPPNASGQNFTALVISTPTSTPGPTQTASPTTYSISGSVKDTLGVALAGITVSDVQGQYVSTTNAEGAYTLNGLPAATYTIAVNSQYYTCTPNKSIVTIPPNAAIHFTCTSAAYTITGKITDAYGAPISGVTLSDGKGLTAITEANGTYSLSGLAAGVYDIFPAKAEYIFSPTTKEIHLPPNASEVNFYGTSGVMDIIVNGNMEKNEAWVMPYDRAGYTMETGAEIRLELTPFPTLNVPVASYASEQFLSGTRSLRIGIIDKNKNVLSYSAARQKVYIPSSAKCASLRYWFYPQSTVGVDGDDFQMVSILDANLNQIQRVITLRSDEAAWKFNEANLDLNKYKGKTIWVYYGVFNDGKNSIMSMYIDDVSLLICSKDIPPLPSVQIPTATH